MSYPFIVWTMQRTGGTSLTELTMAMSEHKSADHEPFNWRRNPRQFAEITRHWVESQDDDALAASLSRILTERHLIKHCYELHGGAFAARLLDAATKTDYRHILLLRRDEMSRLASKFIAEANGTWFRDYSSKVYADIAAKERSIQPLPIDAVVRHYELCRDLTARMRELLRRVKYREIYYEDIYVGEREVRLANLHRLLEFLGFSRDQIEAHRADIETKIFYNGQRTSEILHLVPNLTEVREALAASDRGEPLSVVNKPQNLSAKPTDESGPMIFSRGNGFVWESGLGYDDKAINRLNLRYRAFVAPNAEQYRGARVLDLGSHDGRWAYAALKTGAAHVTGVEFRQETIDKSTYIIPSDMRERIRFIQGDIFNVLPRLTAAGESFDIVQCLGIFYHVLDHHRLLTLITSFHPSLITLDTSLVDSDEPLVKLRTESTEAYTNAPAVFAGQQASLVGIPSRKAMEMLAENLGYKVRYQPWVKSDSSDARGIGDYFNTGKWGLRRYTLYLERA